MMELHLRRGALTEPEVRYYMKQLCLGIEYLHGQQVIHRDLKVGAIFNFPIIFQFSVGKYIPGQKDASENWRFWFGYNEKEKVETDDVRNTKLHGS